MISPKQNTGAGMLPHHHVIFVYHIS